MVGENTNKGWKNVARRSQIVGENTNKGWKNVARRSQIVGENTNNCVMALK